MRDYQAIADALRNASGTRQQRMQRVVDALWEALHDKGVSWVGFYVADEKAADDQRLVLGPRRDKPACSPIGLHGVCGQAWLTQQMQIIDDVHTLGANYIACDPRDRSEIVLPIFDEAGRCDAVLDIDSFEVGSFDESDARGLALALRAAGL